MLNKLRSTVIIAFVLSLFLTSLVGAVPQEINYQGKVTDGDGVPLNGTYDMVFRIFSHPTEGNEFWNEEQSVHIIDGVFNVSLGVVVPIPEGIFTSSYLGLEVEIYNDNSIPPWEILAPRQRLTSTAYAMRAANAETLNGLDSTAFLSTDEGLADLDNGDLLVQGVDSFDATGEEGTVYLGDYGNYIKAVYDSGVRIGAYNAEDALVIQQVTGNVGIGTINPISKLEISDENTAVSYYSSAYGDSQFSSPMYLGRKARGTSTAPTAVQEHDLLNYFGGKGYGGTSWGSSSNAGISLLASENFNDTSKGTKIHFFTTPNGSTSKWSRMVISNEGNVGIGTEVPGEKLEVAGNIEVTGNGNGIIFPDGSGQTSAGHSQVYVNALETRIASLESKMAALEDLLANVTRSGNEITFSGLNIHVVNGTGNTYGAPNSLGNLIVGYNEVRGEADDRSGSHNVVIGKNHNYSAFGGLVAGRYNTISGDYASVSGGNDNTASGDFTSVSGGSYNQAKGLNSSISGGQGNGTKGNFSSISGGAGNKTTTYSSSASISGGNGNTASASGASISGGLVNTASGRYSFVGGGYNNKASGNYSFVGGGGHIDPAYGNEAFSDYSAILGGTNNIAGDNSDPENHDIGEHATISGGSNNTASGLNSSISGGKYNKASGDYSFVGGGGHPSNSAYGNEAFGNYSAILGGVFNITGDKDLNLHDRGELSTISGGDANRARGTWSSISGGKENNANGALSSISGGRKNIAYGDYSSISGGYEDFVTGDYDWRAGDDYFSED